MNVWIRDADPERLLELQPKIILQHRTCCTICTNCCAPDCSSVLWRTGGSSPGRVGAPGVNPQVPLVVGTTDGRSDVGRYCFACHGDDPPRAGHCTDMPFVFDRLDADRVERTAGASPPKEPAAPVRRELAGLASEGVPGFASDVDGPGPSRVFYVPIPDETGAFTCGRSRRIRA